MVRDTEFQRNTNRDLHTPHSTTVLFRMTSSDLFTARWNTWPDLEITWSHCVDELVGQSRRDQDVRRTDIVTLSGNILQLRRVRSFLHYCLYQLNEWIYSTLMAVSCIVCEMVLKSRIFLYPTCIERLRRGWRRRNFANAFATHKTRMIGLLCGEESVTTC